MSRVVADCCAAAIECGRARLCGIACAAFRYGRQCVGLLRELVRKNRTPVRCRAADSGVRKRECAARGLAAAPMRRYADAS